MILKTSATIISIVRNVNRPVESVFYISMASFRRQDSLGGDVRYTENQALYGALNFI
jgi:hypothetical protein